MLSGDLQETALSSNNSQSWQAVICWCACVFSIFYCPFSEGQNRKASEHSLLSNEEKINGRGGLQQE